MKPMTKEVARAAIFTGRIWPNPSVSCGEDGAGRGKTRVVGQVGFRPHRVQNSVTSRVCLLTANAAVLSGTISV
jgi:hypothetical protein